jgi:uncharacterized protein involved in outer membrane biogenesis
MPARRKVVLWSVLTPLALIALLIVVILLFDWNRLKPWLNRTVSESIGRPFAINGDLSITWRKAEAETGWHKWVPWPRLAARDITIGNPDWAAQPNFATAREIDFILRPLPLLSHEIDLPRITVDSPTVSLERQADKRNNWTFPTKTDKKPSEWKLDIGAIELWRGNLALDDKAEKIELRAELDTIGGAPLYDKERDGALSSAASDTATTAASDAAARAASAATSPASSTTAQTKSGASAPTAADAVRPASTAASSSAYGVRWKATGRYNDVTINANGKAGAVLSLRDTSTPYPLQADVRVGATRAIVEGTLTDPAHLAALDVHLELSGDNMSKLYPLTGVVLPDTPPYRTRGRLTANLAKNASEFRYQNFTGVIGESDIGGTLTFAQGEPRPKLFGELLSKQLRFADLAPLIGADAKPGEKAAPDTTVRQPADKALPVAPFRTDRWNAIDANVKFTARRIVKSEDLPITDLSAHLILKDAVLTLDPLNFGMAGGTLVSTLRLDGKREPLGAAIDMTARHLKIKELFPTFDVMKTSIGEINGGAKLTATGNSVSALLGSSNGEAKLLVENGTISKFLLEAMGLNVGSVVISKLFGDKPVQINCGVADFAFTDGVARARTFAIDTQDAVIAVDGAVDFKNEKLALTVHPNSKGLRIISLRAPLYVGGTMKKPAVSPDIAVLALRAGGAAALAVVAPVALAVIPLIDLSSSKESQCGRLLADWNSRTTAPAPGKTFVDPKAGKTTQSTLDGAASSSTSASAPAAAAPAPAPAPRRSAPAPLQTPQDKALYQGG